MGQAPEDGEDLPGGRLVTAVPVKAVTDFLGAFRNDPGSFVTESDPVRQYITERAADELGEWDVLFAGITEARAGENTLRDRSLGFEVRCQRRAEGQDSDAASLRIEKSRVSSRGVERIGLTPDQIEEAKQNYSGTNYPDRIFRAVRTRPLFILHLLAIGKEGEDLSGAKPVVAWSISFPKTGREEARVEYMVNTTWFREHYPDEDEEEAAGDE